MGEDAVPVLRKALDSKPSEEARRRMESILRKPRPPSPETVQVIRGVEVLEHIGTPEARQLLESLAEGAPEAVLTREAKGALERLIQQSPGR